MREKILQIYGISLLLGLLTGLAGSLFQLGIRWLTAAAKHTAAIAGRHHISATLVAMFISTIMVLIAWLMVKKIAPEASGSGVQEIEGALSHLRPVFWRRLLPVKFFGGVLSNSAGLVVGREGPTIQIGGNLAAMLSEKLHLKQRRQDALIAAGSAAGLATAFNAPLAGVLFVIEEMRPFFQFNFTNFKMVAICCMMAAITTQWILGNQPAITMTVFTMPSLSALWLFFLFGVAAGFAGVLFNRCLMRILSFSDRFSFNQKMLYVAITGAAAGFLTLHFPSIAGGGYDIIEQSLNLSPGFALLCIILVLRFFTSLICYTTQVPGGIFAPMLALGTLLGLACFDILHLLFPNTDAEAGMFAVAGMGALFSGTIRAPLTGIVLIVEMTQNYSLILPLMVSSLTATTIGYLLRNEPTYTQLLRRTLSYTVKTPSADEKV